MRLEFHLGCVLVFGSALLLGCAGNSPADGGHADHDEESAEHGHDADHGQEEEHEGPHEGHVIELGRSHEYHAELVDDDQAKTVTVYILDKDLKPLPIDAATVSLNLTAKGEAKSFDLAAVDPMDGKASQFTSSDAAAFETLHVDEATGKLRVTIGGESYTGEIEHHEHHEDHEHHEEH